jgi:RNA 2',3'-cyclic 3'-phosphodiesterase
MPAASRRPDRGGKTTRRRRVRLFVALDFAGSIRDSIRDLVGRLKPLRPDARWARVEGMHVTLKFIGHVEEAKLNPIVSALADIRLARPVELHFRGIGFFPTERRPRVCWCGIEASGNLVELAAEIERSLLPLGVAAEKREFVPHLTLSRFDSPRGLDKLVEKAGQLGSLDLGTSREREFYLFESVLERSGARYSKLRSFAFAKEAQ